MSLDPAYNLRETASIMSGAVDRPEKESDYIMQSAVTAHMSS
jgi:hypothetical protein